MDLGPAIRQRYLKRDKYLHSKEHVLADDLSRTLGEPKRFAAYLGIANSYDEADLRSLARRVLEKADLPPAARGKYFFAAIKGLRRRPAPHRVRTRPAKKHGTARRRNHKTSRSGAPRASAGTRAGRNPRP